MTEAKDRIALGTRIKEARTYRGFSQEEVATFLGLSRSSISLIESGSRGVDTLELQKLAGLFECSVNDLIGSVDKTQATQGTVALVARVTRQLAPEDRDEVLRFAEFLQARKKSRGNVQP